MRRQRLFIRSILSVSINLWALCCCSDVAVAQVPQDYGQRVPDLKTITTKEPGGWMDVGASRERRAGEGPTAERIPEVRVNPDPVIKDVEPDEVDPEAQEEAAEWLEKERDWLETGRFENRGDIEPPDVSDPDFDPNIPTEFPPEVEPEQEPEGPNENGPADTRPSRAGKQPKSND